MATKKTKSKKASKKSAEKKTSSIEASVVIKRANELCDGFGKNISHMPENASVEYAAVLLALQFMLARFTVEFHRDEEQILLDVKNFISQERANKSVQAHA